MDENPYKSPEMLPEKKRSKDERVNPFVLAWVVVWFAAILGWLAVFIFLAGGTPV